MNSNFYEWLITILGLILFWIIQLSILDYIKKMKLPTVFDKYVNKIFTNINNIYGDFILISILYFFNFSFLNWIYFIFAIIYTIIQFIFIGIFIYTQIGIMKSRIVKGFNIEDKALITINFSNLINGLTLLFITITVYIWLIK